MLVSLSRTPRWRPKQDSLWQYTISTPVDLVLYGAPEGTRKLKSFEWLDCTNNKVLNVAIAQTIKF